MKVLFLLSLFLLLKAHAMSPGKWNEYSRHPEDNIKHLIELLSRSSTGRELLAEAKTKAEQHGKTLLDVIKPGQVSITDTTLTRRFSTSEPGSITFHEVSVVYIDKDLSTYDALLDLAHELTHYIYRQPFNPYKKDFSLQPFISSTIEGTGGEVDAYLMECRVMRELYSSEVKQRYNCQEIVDPNTSTLSRDLAINKFYRVGEHYQSFHNKLKSRNIEAPRDLSGGEPVFISSAYGLPYPVAAFYEFVSILNRVCENDKNRLSYMKENLGRSPASKGSDEVIFQNIKISYDHRCGSLDSYLALVDDSAAQR
ncbi:MAG: hypothetical protein JNM93_13830 [Bacteriovoracaceae bacterium]|nr:hypothetical protein [Bacteriovoracaceae bacterium]